MAGKTNCFGDKFWGSFQQKDDQKISRKAICLSIDGIFSNWQNEVRSTMKHPSHRGIIKKPLALLRFMEEKAQWPG
jgi:hypothetical protein